MTREFFGEDLYILQILLLRHESIARDITAIDRNRNIKSSETLYIQLISFLLG